MIPFKLNYLLSMALVVEKIYSDVDPCLKLNKLIHVLILECGIRLASAGYAVFGMDYEGHGRSTGSRCYIKKFANVVNDCYDYYTSICGITFTYITTTFRISSSPFISKKRFSQSTPS